MGLFGFGSGGSGDVVAHGRSDQATVVGMLVTGGGGRPRTIDYALDVDAPAPFRAAVRLSSRPPMVVRLGTTLQVLHLDSRVVVDWLGSGADEVVETRPLKAAPAPDIEDRTLGLGPIQISGVPAQATVESAEVRPASRGDGPGLHLALFVERHGLSGYGTEVTLTHVPHYADHLCAVGRTLPVWLLPGHPDDLVIDWPAAATSEPGLGEPPSAIVAGLTDAPGPAPRRARTGHRRDPQGRETASTDDDDVIIDLTRDPETD